MSSALFVGAVALVAASGCSAAPAAETAPATPVVQDPFEGVAAAGAGATTLSAPQKFEFALVKATELIIDKVESKEIIASWGKVDGATNYELCYDIVATKAQGTTKTDIRNVCVTTPMNTYNGPVLSSDSATDGWKYTASTPRVRAISPTATSSFADGTVGSKAPEGVKPMCTDKDKILGGIPPLEAVTKPTEISLYLDPDRVGLDWEMPWQYADVAKSTPLQNLPLPDKIMFEVCGGYTHEKNTTTNATSFVNCTIINGKDKVYEFNPNNKNSYRMQQPTKLPNGASFQNYLASVRPLELCHNTSETLGYMYDMSTYTIYVVGDQPSTPSLNYDSMNKLPSTLSNSNRDTRAFLAYSHCTLPSSSFSMPTLERFVAVANEDMNIAERGPVPPKMFVRVGPSSGSSGQVSELRVGNETCLMPDGPVAAGIALVSRRCPTIGAPAGAGFEIEFDDLKWVVDVNATETTLKLVNGTTEMCVGFTKTQSKYDPPMMLMACDASDKGQKFSFKEYTGQMEYLPALGGIEMSIGGWPTATMVDNSAPAVTMPAPAPFNFEFE